MTVLSLNLYEKRSKMSQKPGLYLILCARRKISDGDQKDLRCCFFQNKGLHSESHTFKDRITIILSFFNIQTPHTARIMHRRISFFFHLNLKPKLRGQRFLDLLVNDLRYATKDLVQKLDK